MPRNACVAAPVSHGCTRTAATRVEPRIPRHTSPQQRDQARRRRRVQSWARRPRAEPQHRLSHHSRQTEAEPDDQPGLGFAADSRQPRDPRSQAQQRQDERKPHGRGRAGCHQQRRRDARERGSRGEPSRWSGELAPAHRPREANPRRVGLLKPGDAHRPAADEHPAHQPNRMRAHRRRASQQQAGEDRADHVQRWTEQHPASLQTGQPAGICGWLAHVLARAGITEVPHPRRDGADEIAASRTCDQLLAQHRPQADAVVVDLAVQPRGSAGMIVPDDRARLVGQSVSAAQNASEQIQILAAPRRRGGTERRIEATKLARHRGPHHDARPRAEAACGIWEQRIRLARLR